MERTLRRLARIWAKGVTIRSSACLEEVNRVKALRFDDDEEEEEDGPKLKAEPLSDLSVEDFRFSVEPLRPPDLPDSPFFPFLWNRGERKFSFCMMALASEVGWRGGGVSRTIRAKKGVGDLEGKL